jgi:hypothetical protein
VSGPRVMERVWRTAALGVRFHDTAAPGPPVTGLVVEVFPRANPRARTLAHANPSGVYVAHAVPGLRGFELGDPRPDAAWTAALRPYRVEVTDPLGRFLPMAFDADLPARGLFTGPAGWMSPPEAPLDGIPLFSAPSRAVPDPLAVVYAHLRERGSRREAAWSLLGVSIGGRSRGVGLADRHGRVAVVFPYPEPPRRALASPPEPRNDFSWDASLTAYVAPPPPPPGPVPERADLADVLAALTEPGAEVDPVPLRLAYRQPLTARTPGAAGADASYLWVSA